MIMLYCLPSSRSRASLFRGDNRISDRDLKSLDPEMPLHIVNGFPPRMCFSERYSLKFDLGKLTLLNLSVKIPFKIAINYCMRHLVKKFCAFQLFIQRPLEESSYSYKLDLFPPLSDATNIDRFQRFQLGISREFPTFQCHPRWGSRAQAFP